MGGRPRRRRSRWRRQWNGYACGAMMGSTWIGRWCRRKMAGRRRGRHSRSVAATELPVSSQLAPPVRREQREDDPAIPDAEAGEKGGHPVCVVRGVRAPQDQEDPERGPAHAPHGGPEQVAVAIALRLFVLALALPLHGIQK